MVGVRWSSLYSTLCTSVRNTILCLPALLNSINSLLWAGLAKFANSQLSFDLSISFTSLFFAMERQYLILPTVMLLIVVCNVVHPLQILFMKYGNYKKDHTMAQN